MKPIERREFLKSAMIAGAAVERAGRADPMLNPQQSGQQVARSQPRRLAGAGKMDHACRLCRAESRDEFTLCQELGQAKASAHLKRHRETWITADDFQWLAAHGLNAVRLPINYGIAEENPPFITGMETLDWAFRTAKAHGLGVLLDLHGVPGSQNGWDHSGRQGTLGWHTSKANIDHSLRIITDLAVHCQGL